METVFAMRRATLGGGLVGAHCVRPQRPPL
jgi:hypothetical protein